MATVVKENIGTLHDKLIVKVGADDYSASVDKKIKEYSKAAAIPGFRKGMVPVGVIKKMYGNSIFADEVLKSAEKELFNYLNKEKPEIFGEPLPLKNDIADLNINNPSSYEFHFEIGVKPDYNLPDLSKAQVTLHKVIVTEDMVNEEVNRMQIKGGKMTEPEVIDNVDTVLNILFTESADNGDRIENGAVKENSVILKYLTDEAQKMLIGKKVGDSVVMKLNEAFSEDKLPAILQDLGFDSSNKDAANKYFNIEIKKVGLIEKRALNEDFFKEIYPAKDIKTEEELRIHLKKEIQQYWDNESRKQLQDQLYHYLLDETKIEFPIVFLKRWLLTSGEESKTIEQVEAEFPAFSNQLKWTLISDKIVKENHLEVNKEELREYMKAEIMRYFGNINIEDDTNKNWLESYIDRMMKDKEHVNRTHQQLITQKLFTWIETQVKVNEKEITADELIDMQHNHHH